MNEEMQEISNRLVKKHLSTEIKKIVSDCFEKNFERIFKEHCSNTCLNVSTFSATFSDLLRESIENVYDFLELEFRKIRFTTDAREDFFDMILHLWGDFQQCVYIDDIVEDYLSDLTYKVELELRKMGILDTNGDHIGPEEGFEFKFIILSKKESDRCLYGYQQKKGA